MRTIKETRTACGLLIGLGVWLSASADMVSWDVVSSGGVVGSSSGNVRLSASVGQPAVDVLGGGGYRIYSGFWNPGIFSPVGAKDKPARGLPTTFQLSQNYPNPFADRTTIDYALPMRSRLTLEIYDLSGHRVRLLADGIHEPGYHVARWDGKNGYGRQAGSGAYVFRMRARADNGNEFSRNRTLLLLR